MLRAGIAVVFTLCLVACQTPPNVQQLQDKNQALTEQLAKANLSISELKAKQSKQDQDMAELNRVIAVLGEEKTSRVSESSDLRGAVRGFMQVQIDQLKNFLLKSNLLDYIGGELVARKQFDEDPVFIADLANQALRDGVLTGVGGIFNAPGQLKVKILRRIDDELVVVWESRPLSIVNTGEQRLQFAVSVGVQRGDMMGYFFSNPGMVAFDTGTSDTRYLRKDVPVGDTVKISSLSGENQRRAYSIGVFGLMSVETQ